jgi:adenylate cyclase class 2
LKGGVETEIKLRVGDPAAARAAVLAIGASLARARHFEDNVLFDDDARSLLSKGSALRVRRVDEAADRTGEEERGGIPPGVLTFKGPRQIIEGVKSRQEIETVVADADAAQALLQALGYRPVFRYQKYREVYRWNSAEIVVDETPIGTFLEVEGDLEAVHAAAAALGYARAQYVSESYAALYLAAGGQGDMIYR